jgi:hypothetical protein
LGRALLVTLLCALAIAALSTLGDFIWAGLGLGHRVPYGLTHGTLLFAGVGLVLGTVARRLRAGSLAGALVGFAAAGSFYLLFPILGYAMFAVWFLVWVALALIYNRLGPQAGVLSAIGRGLGAGVASGAAFYMISGIWFPFDPEGWDYLVHFGAWTVAYLPGFTALLVGGRAAS